MLSERLLVELALVMHAMLLIAVKSLKIWALRETFLTCCFYNFIWDDVTHSATRPRLKGGYGIAGRIYRSF